MPIRPEMRSRYPKDWRARSRFVREYRARGRCEWCGAENGKPHPQTGGRVVLTTAHVFDKRPEAASLLNLAALCQKCHNCHDAADRLAGRRARARGPQLAFWPETGGLREKEGRTESPPKGANMASGVEMRKLASGFVQCRPERTIRPPIRLKCRRLDGTRVTEAPLRLFMFYEDSRRHRCTAQIGGQGHIGQYQN